MVDSKPQEVQLDADGYIAMTCPVCATKRVASAEHYGDLHVPIGVECICGLTYDIIIDTRQYYRSNLRLPGVYTMTDSTVRRHIAVETLSFSGSCFRPMPPSDLRVGDVLHLSFQLDHELGTEVHKQAVVRWVKNSRAGVEFCNVQTYDKELGAYLRPRS